MLAGKWRLYDPHGDLRVELLDVPSHDREACTRWERELRTLLWRAGHDLEVRRVLEEVYDTVRGNGGISLHGWG